MSFTLPDLNFDYDALEPYIDGKTMEVHHQKHHRSYLEKFNSAIKDTDLEKKTPTEIFANVSELPPKIRNNGGGFYNHAIFWKFLSPERMDLEDKNLADAINKYFGTFDNMKKEFATVAENQFGSGWAWLIKREEGELIICSTANQDNPLMDISSIRGTPILCLDLWEHAYYLKYQNRRSEYISSFWNVVNWKKVEDLYNR